MIDILHSKHLLDPGKWRKNVIDSLSLLITRILLHFIIENRNSVKNNSSWYLQTKSAEKPLDRVRLRKLVRRFWTTVAQRSSTIALPMYKSNMFENPEKQTAGKCRLDQYPPMILNPLTIFRAKYCQSLARIASSFIFYVLLFLRRNRK